MLCIYGIRVRNQFSVLCSRFPVDVHSSQTTLASYGIIHETRLASFTVFLGRARGALVEVETELILAQNLEYLNPEQSQKLLSQASQLGKILNGLAGAIRPAA